MLKTHMAACLVATMFAAPAFAQAPASPSTAPATGTPAMNAPARTDATMPSQGMSGNFMTKIEVSHITASELIGTRVISADNESIGDINDVIMDRQGKALAAVVGVGGFLGIGEKDVAVPFSALEFATREQVSAMTRKDSAATTGSTTTTTTTSNAVNAPAAGTTATTTTATDSDGEPERVILRMTKAQLQAAPAFDDDRDDVKTGTTSTTTTAPAAPVKRP